jgi:hypothetical protein
MMPDDVYVVFTDQTDLWWLKFLRHGFRHCFVLIRFADIWISVDALAHKTEIMRIDVPDSFSIVGWLESQGERVVKAIPQSQNMTPLCPSFFSCVENVKRILGLRASSVVTPWQLFKYLKKCEERTS